MIHSQLLVLDDFSAASGTDRLDNCGSVVFHRTAVVYKTLSSVHFFKENISIPSWISNDDGTKKKIYHMLTNDRHLKVIQGTPSRRATSNMTWWQCCHWKSFTFNHSANQKSHPQRRVVWSDFTQRQRHDKLQQLNQTIRPQGWESRHSVICICWTWNCWNKALLLKLYHGTLLHHYLYVLT